MKPILVVLDLDRKIRIDTDVLDYVIEEVLLMKYSDRKQRLIAYLSKYFNETERNYEIHSKEMLAVIRGLENQKHLLEGAKYKFEV